MKFDLKNRTKNLYINMINVLNTNHSNDKFSDDRQPFTLCTYPICSKLFACNCNNLCGIHITKEMFISIIIDGLLQLTLKNYAL